ncbi:MAG: asparagine synthase (glutamine-hydrolyzing) [Cyclobacteriaceae bacterium]|jgi:asparagine synthase (glutamine-hydrolysing)|nr:asparagine synthase (glutamine-hydrolyzing) [Cytophagales bacterium]MCZ8327954.1 asparagine synthase (glutamine-hydrolyzing) [Cyclobacteriaceae bacterium]
MCGIAGFIGESHNQIDLQAVCRAIAHRGPDGQGIFADDEIALIHTRLAIIDLTDAAKQPFQFKNWVLIFNGEIYNYKEIRNELLKLGYQFQTQSDTEVIIKAYDCWREKAVEHFIGMFAFAIYNLQNKSLQLFRDRLGVKPLYYAIEKNVLYFASELKVFKHFPVSKTINNQSLTHYFSYGYTPSSQSIYSAVKKLPAGSYLTYHNQESKIQSYWHIPAPEENFKSESKVIEELQELLISACKYRMVSDVPVGVFLSGGIDSSLVSAILSKHFGAIKAFNIGFEEQSFNESIYAEKVAKHLQIEFHSSTLSLKEAKKYFDQFYSIYDEPFADTSGIPTACVSAFAKSKGVKVVLSADGGDELFAGYTHYQQAIQLYTRLHILPAQARKALRGLSKFLITKKFRKAFVALNFEHKIFALEELLEASDFKSFYNALIANQAEDELAQLLVQAEVEYKTSSSQHQPLYEMRKWDLENYMADDLLVKVDRATMFNQIECREPLLDHRLTEFAFKLPPSIHQQNQSTKYLLRKILGNYLPHQLFDRKKQGFSIPVFQWFKDELDQLFDQYLSKNEIEKTGLLHYSEVESEWKKYRYYKKIGKEYNIEKMWRLLSFMIWYKKYQNE